jgi:hypothetical protein
VTRDNNFPYSTVPRPVLRPTQPPIQRIPGVISPVLKQAGHEADHSYPSNVEVNNDGAIPPFSHMSSWGSTEFFKHRDIFAFICLSTHPRIFVSFSRLVPSRSLPIHRSSRIRLNILQILRLSPLGTAATIGLLYRSQMIDDDDCGAIGGMKIVRGNRSTRGKPTPAPLRPP